MPIKNYTTNKSAGDTVGEIQAMLANHGATKIMIDYNNGKPYEIMFIINTPKGHQPVKLPARADRALAVMKKQDISAKYKTEDHALKVAWRNVKDWLDAQLALLEMEMVTIDEVMLPYSVITMVQRFMSLI